MTDHAGAPTLDRAATHSRHRIEPAHERAPERDAGAAVVFENHVALTANRAWLVRKHVSGIKGFGGIVLRA